MELYINLVILSVLSFVQNCTFTAASRSRNSGDWNYHMKIAFASNGVWFITHFFILKQVWEVLQNDDWTRLFLVGIVYVISTSLGSRFMMKRMLQSETGARRVGANNEKI